MQTDKNNHTDGWRLERISLWQINSDLPNTAFIRRWNLTDDTTQNHRLAKQSMRCLLPIKSFLFTAQCLLHDAVYKAKDNEDKQNNESKAQNILAFVMLIKHQLIPTHFFSTCFQYFTYYISHSLYIYIPSSKPQNSLLQASLFIPLGTSLLAPQIWHLLILCTFIKFHLLTYLLN